MGRGASLPIAILLAILQILMVLFVFGVIFSILVLPIIFFGGWWGLIPIGVLVLGWFLIFLALDIQEHGMW